MVRRLCTIWYQVFYLIKSIGRCTVAVLLPEGSGASNSIYVDTMEMNGAAEDLRGKCVQAQGIGGRFHQSNDDRDEQINELPEIFMFGPNSKWKQFLDLKYKCAVDANGDAECKPAEKPPPRTKGGAYGVWRYMGTIGKQGWTPMPKGSKNKCSGSCLNATDCDINSDCLCASDKGMSSSRVSPREGFGKLTDIVQTRLSIKQLLGTTHLHVRRWRCSRSCCDRHFSTRMPRSMLPPR